VAFAQHVHRDAPLHEHVRYVYGLAAGGSFGICCLINVMSQKEGHPVVATMSLITAPICSSLKLPRQVVEVEKHDSN
jgi:hypothetical protein